MAHVAVAAHMVAQATKASGAIVRLQAADFLRLLDRAPEPLVVVAKGGVFRDSYKYLTGYKGLVLFTKSDRELVLPRHCEVVAAEKIWIPE